MQHEWEGVERSGAELGDPCLVSLMLGHSEWLAQEHVADQHSAMAFAWEKPRDPALWVAYQPASAPRRRLVFRDLLALARIESMVAIDVSRMSWAMQNIGEFSALTRTTTAGITENGSVYCLNIGISAVRARDRGLRDDGFQQLWQGWGCRIAANSSCSPGQPFCWYPINLYPHLALTLNGDPLSLGVPCSHG